MNESGTINTRRLQLVLDEMKLWEQDVFQKEYADLNWYKGKQAKHVREMELGEKRSKLGMSLPLFPSVFTYHTCFPSVLTSPQREIFDKVKAFVMENRQAASMAHTRAARLAMPNDFPARERKFIGKLAEDLHLSLRWDEFDEEDVNLVTWRFPGALEESEGDGEDKSNGDQEVDVSGEVHANAENGVEADGGESEWEDDVEDEESRAAVDRVLKKYEKAPVERDDEGGGFDARYERSIKEKMDEWKRDYYRVCSLIGSFTMGTHLEYDRENSRSRMISQTRWGIWCTAMWKDFNGSCIIIMVVSHRGDGSMITIMHHAYQVGSHTRHHFYFISNYNVQISRVWIRCRSRSSLEHPLDRMSSLWAYCPWRARITFLWRIRCVAPVHFVLGSV